MAVTVLVEVVLTTLVEVDVARWVIVTEGWLVTVDVLMTVLVEPGRVVVLFTVVVTVAVVVAAGTWRVVLTVAVFRLTVVTV